MIDPGQGKLAVFIGPKDYIADSDGFTLVHLKHPKSGEAALFSFKNSESHDVREIITLNHDFSAWFIGDVIESDGRLMMASPVDPLLLVLPYLRSAARPVPLDHLLMEDEADYPDLVSRLVPVLLARGLSPIANSKGTADLNVWQYDEKKTLTYLTKKVDRLSKELAKMRAGSSAAPNDEDRRSSWTILSDYLEPEVSTLLSTHMGIKMEEPKKVSDSSGKTLINLTGSRDLGGASSGDNVKGRPTEDYSDAPKSKAAKMCEPTAKQKALAKSATGSKNIMSFFAKK